MQQEANSLSFWQNDAGSQQRYPALERDTSAEVAVIGGGVTGAACALWLARAGRRVVLLERETLAHGASGRNGGFLSAGTAAPYDQAVTVAGRERARRLFAFSMANNATVRELAAELAEQGWSIGYRQSGSLRLADSPEELALVHAGARLLKEDGWPAELLDEQQMPACLRGHYLGGSYHAQNGALQPARLVLGLARLAQQAGALIHEQTPALGIQETSAGVSIATPAGGVQAQAVIVATNAWLGALLPARYAPLAAQIVTPTRGQMLATAPLAQRYFDGPISAHYGYQYWRQLEDGRLIVGGWRNYATGYDQRAPTQAPTNEVQAHLDHFVARIVGAPARTAITHRWAGLMAFTRDSLPLVGRLPESEHIVLCGGYTGHGNAMAPRCAQVAADLACGLPNDEAELFRPDRWLAADERHM